MANSYVQLPADGAGKKVQTYQNSVGGNTVEANAACLVNSAGTPLDAPGSAVGVPITGNIAHDGVDAGAPLKVGGKASTSFPTAVADADRVDAYVDEYGRQHVRSGRVVTSVSQTPTITAGLYAADDALGGKLTFANAVRWTAGSGRIKKVIVVDLGSQDAVTDLVLFNQDFTATADNAAMDPSDGDVANCVGHISLVAADYATFANNSVATKEVDFPFVLTGTSLYGQLVTRGTPTYTSTSDIKVILVIEQD